MKHLRILFTVLFIGTVMTVWGDTSTMRQITFRVLAVAELEPDEAVYIAGGSPALGDWKADGFKLTYQDDGFWTGNVEWPSDQPVEFKVTKGSWDTERLLADASVPPNERIEPGEDTVVNITALRWKRPGPPTEPRITGLYRIHESVASIHLALPRHAIVWLPPSYEREPDRRYPVLYMHDGQQVFDPQTSTHGQDWEVDEWCMRLIEDGRLQEIIVVGIYCTADRSQEYNPAHAGKKYARFLIEELKPMIDEEYRTLPGRDTTAVAGASMGGKISFHLAWEHPDTFFGAACLSPAFLYDPPNELDRVRLREEPPPDVRLYLYCGAGDPLEQRLLPGTREMASLLEKRGFERGRSLMLTIDEAAPHTEAAWMKHTGEWLMFLFPAE